MKKRRQTESSKKAMNQDELRRVLSDDRRNSEEASKDAFDMINEYGTYEIQPTANTDNTFPAIAQGLPKDWDFDKPKESHLKH